MIEHNVYGEMPPLPTRPGRRTACLAARLHRMYLIHQINYGIAGWRFREHELAVTGARVEELARLFDESVNV